MRAFLSSPTSPWSLAGRVGWSRYAAALAICGMDPGHFLSQAYARRGRVRDLGRLSGRGWWIGGGGHVGVVGRAAHSSFHSGSFDSGDPLRRSTPHSDPVQWWGANGIVVLGLWRVRSGTRRYGNMGGLARCVRNVQVGWKKLGIFRLFFFSGPFGWSARLYRCVQLNHVVCLYDRTPYILLLFFLKRKCEHTLIPPLLFRSIGIPVLVVPVTTVHCWPQRAFLHQGWLLWKGGLNL
jgi:hypothetical protein